MSTYSNDPRQDLWERWFIISIIFLLSTLFIGTLYNSKTNFPNYLYWLTGATINLIICLIIGLRKNG